MNSKIRLLVLSVIILCVSTLVYSPGEKTYAASLGSEPSVITYNTELNGYEVENANEFIFALNLLQDQVDDAYEVVDQDGIGYEGEKQAAIYLAQDIELGSEIINVSNGTFAIYLQGFQIYSDKEKVLQVTGGNLTVDGKNGIIGTRVEFIVRQFALVTGGILNIKNCTIIPSTRCFGHVIEMSAGGTVNMNQVSITAPSSTGIVYAHGKTTIANIKNCSLTTENGKVIESYGANVTVDGGKLTANKTVINTLSIAEDATLTIKGNANIYGGQGKMTGINDLYPAIITEQPIDIQSGTITGYNAGVQAYGDITVSGGMICATGAYSVKNISVGLYIGNSSENQTRTIAISGGDFHGMRLESEWIPYGIYNESDIPVADMLVDGYKFNRAAEVVERGILGYVYCSTVDSEPRKVAIVYNLAGDDGCVENYWALDEKTAALAVNAPNNPTYYEIGSGYVPLEAPTCPGKVLDTWYIRYNGFFYGRNVLNRDDYMDSTVIVYAKWKTLSHAHTGNSVEQKNATCTDLGIRTYYECTCGKYFEDEACKNEILDLIQWKNGAGRIDKKAHSGGVATCKIKAKCASCGMEYGSLATHTYATKWSTDATNHWHACTVCGAKKDNASHTDSDKNEKCDTCDYNMHSHSGTKVAQVDATCTSYGVKAYYKCSCGKYYTDSACTKKITDLATWKNGDGRIAKKEHVLKTTTTKATTTSNGKNETKCSVCGKVTKAETIYMAKNIKLSATKYTYDGKVKNPSVTIKDSKGNAIASTNYTVTCPSGRKNVGKYTVKVTFKGNYSGSKNLTFTINPPKTSISTLTAGKKAFTVKWDKKTSQVTGYEIQYSTSSTFAKGNKDIKVTSAKTVSKAINKLTGGQKYYVRIRTYKTVEKTPYYSEWSAKKSVKTKKK